MWPWMKRWRDWAIRELWPMYRFFPQALSMKFGYQKAGLFVFDQPIPWNADKVRVEIELRLPNSASRAKSEYRLAVADGSALEADDLRREGIGDRYVATYQFSPPGHTTSATFSYRGHQLGSVGLPVLSKEVFLDGLSLEMPTVSVRLGEKTVVCQRFVSSQGQGLIANGMLRAESSLTPVNDLDLRVCFRHDSNGHRVELPASFCQGQLGRRELVFNVEPARLPRKIGVWTVEWKLGERVLATQPVEAISARRFQKGVKLCDSRFVLQDAQGKVETTHQIPTLSKVDRVGPCFFLHSTEPGTAGLCKVRVCVQVPGSIQPPVLFDEKVLVTDVPTMIAPGTTEAGDLHQVLGFELFVEKKSMGLLSLRPAPTAKFTSEGGYAPPQSYRWTDATESEMLDRLQRLMGPESPRE